MDKEEQQVNVNFESHPPIQEDLVGISKLIRQTFLSFANCDSLAQYLIDFKDVTQVIALEPEEDEPDNDIYGVISVIDLKDEKSDEVGANLLKFLRTKCPRISELSEDKDSKLGLVINERYINLPAQLSVPTFKNLTEHLEKQKYTHLIFLTKIMIKSKSSDSNLPSKKMKTSSSAEPLLYANPEEEIVFEGSDDYVDFDVSDQCDENALWAFGSDAKYIPHRRILIVDFKKWRKILKSLDEELSVSK